jgi:hypothetical protein
MAIAALLLVKAAAATATAASLKQFAVTLQGAAACN